MILFCAKNIRFLGRIIRIYWLVLWRNESYFLSQRADNKCQSGLYSYCHMFSFRQTLRITLKRLKSHINKKATYVGREKHIEELKFLVFVFFFFLKLQTYSDLKKNSKRDREKKKSFLYYLIMPRYGNKNKLQHFHEKTIQTVTLI